MTHATAIEWMTALADSRGLRAAVWNPIRGCKPAGDGCRNCWAAEVAVRRANHPNAAIRARHEGLAYRASDGRAVFNGTWRFIADQLDVPLRTRKPTVYFVGSETDLFGEGVPDEWLDRVMAVMALCPQHLFLVLTKRPGRMREYMSAREPKTPTWPLPNLWLGCSIWDQDSANRFVPHLLDTPAALRFVSAEPLLGVVNIDLFSLCGCGWVIAGGESGPRARPCHPDWARQLRDDCQTAGVPFFWKQWGEWGNFTDAPAPRGIKGNPAVVVLDGNGKTRGGGLLRNGYNWEGPGRAEMIRVGKKAAGRLLDGREWAEVPQ